MKRTYQKPEILFESFTLSTNIAGDCEIKTDLQSQNGCGVPLGPLVVFLETVQGCDKKVEADDGLYNGICYHVPSANTNVFNS